MLRRRGTLQLCLAAVIGLLPAFAQETTGGIVGTIRDSSGSIVAGAKVTAVNQATDLQSQTLTGNRDRFIHGTYLQCQIEAHPRGGVHNDVGPHEFLESGATVGQVVEQRAIESIPLATRNFTQILGTSAGVSGGIFNADPQHRFSQ
jgi:hypothetical protein